MSLLPGVTGVVTSGGRLHGRPGIRIPSERLSMPTPTIVI